MGAHGGDIVMYTRDELVVAVIPNFSSSLEFQKAFGCVPHLDKLHIIGLHPHIIHWIHSYLAEQKQRVVLNGETSESLNVTSGVPQGSILGLLLH